MSLWSTAMRALSRELKGHALTIRIGDMTREIYTDDEGYYDCHIPTSALPEALPPVVLYAELHGEIIEREVAVSDHRGMTAGILSDIDDTILVTGVKSFLKWRVVINTLFVNAFRRKAQDHAAALYTQMDKLDQQKTLFVYLSNSPWNLYDYLQTFLKHNKFPKGELLLRDFGRHLIRKSHDLKAGNKYKELIRMMEAHPECRWTLLGDSAEADLDIYLLAHERYPDRIDRIIIRAANNERNEDRIRGIIGDSAPVSIELIDSYRELLSEELVSHAA